METATQGAEAAGAYSGGRSRRAGFAERDGGGDPGEGTGKIRGGRPLHGRTRGARGGAARREPRHRPRLARHRLYTASRWRGGREGGGGPPGTTRSGAPIRHARGG